MADDAGETIERRVAALETRVAAEAESVKEHFVELQNFISFTVTRQVDLLRTELKRDIRRVDERLESLERKMDAHHDATRLILADILDRLPPRQL
jgi:hypothetical protein